MYENYCKNLYNLLQKIIHVSCRSVYQHLVSSQVACWQIIESYTQSQEPLKIGQGRFQNLTFFHTQVIP